MKREKEIRKAALERHPREVGDNFGLICRGEFMNGAQWADEHPNWISLKDKKPPRNERVFLCAEDWHEPSIGRLMIVGGKEVYLDEDFSKVIVDEITLWMPFPKAPKGGKK